MKKQSYKVLCHVDLLHGYYADGIFKQAKVTPDEKSQVFMWNAGLLFKTTTKGFAIYYGANFDAAYVQELTSFFGNFYIRLNLYSTANDFVYITETPLEQLSLYHFSNRNLSGQDAHLMLPTLQADILMSGTLGYIDIHLDEFLDFVIAFEARTTQWNYYLANVNDEGTDDLLIQDSEGNIFSGPEKITISNGTTAYKYSSGQQYYPLKETPSHFCTLKKKVDALQEQPEIADSSDILIEKLPAASPSSITSIENIESDQQEIACSSIYVYL
jgi:hypothetical protein